MNINVFPRHRKLNLFNAVKRRLRGSGPVCGTRQDVLFLERSGMFDQEWYLARYPDVADSKIDPIEHYVLHGADENRNPSEFFDTKYYRESNPDVASSGINPFRHFCEFGWREGRNPSHDFKLQTYAAEKNLPADTNPFLHFVKSNPIRPGGLRADAEIFGAPGLFDEAFYVSRNDDVPDSGLMPFEHFLRHGVKEGRDPCAFFDSKYYLKDNPDVARAAMPPFRHFCLYGWRELRNPSRSFDIRRYWLEYMVPVKAWGNPLAYYGTIGKANGHKPVGVGESAAADETNLIRRAEEVLLAASSDQEPEMLEALGHLLIDSKRWQSAESAFRGALASRWDSARLNSRLAETLERQGKWWQVIECLDRAVALDGSQAAWFMRLGNAHEKMNRLEPAVEAFRRALALDSSKATWHYRLGRALERLGHNIDADGAYGSAIALDGREEARRFGVGFLHQERGNWSEAAAAYARTAEDSPLDAELIYRMGIALDRCYRWSEAQSALELAITLAPSNAYWHYRLGFVMERQRQWDRAADAYAAGVLQSDKFLPYWSYRQGYVLQKAERYKEACAAYVGMQKRQTVSGHQLALCSGQQDVPLASRERILGYERYLAGLARPAAVEAALERDRTSADFHYEAGRQYEIEGSWKDAALAYKNAVARKDDHDPEWYYRLGYVLTKIGSYLEACQAFANTRPLRRAFGVPLGRLAPQKIAEKHYLEYCEELPIAHRTILYESYHGASVGCNPGAIFQYLIDDPDYSEWLHVWAINDKSRIPTKWKNRSNVIFVKRGSDLYRRYLATAGHLVNNNTFMPWFSRRPPQKYLNTWHGTPLKKLGRDIRGDFMAHRNAARNLLHATHIISPNRHTSEVLVLRNDVKGSFRGSVAETGYPRIDRTLNLSSSEKSALKNRLGLAEDHPVVLYAPTWRGNLDSAKVDLHKLREDLSRLAALPCQLIFRGHHMVEKEIAKIDLPVITVSPDVDTNELLSVVDVLISDYSSIFFDFLPTKRPIIKYAHDLEEYSAERGLYFDLDEVPGRLCRSSDALLTAVSEALVQANQEPACLQEALQKFCPLEDGLASRRAVEFFLKGDSTYIVDEFVDKRRSLLLYAGAFIPNGITTSCLNLLRSVDESTYKVTVVIDPASVSGDAARVDKLAQLPEGISVLARAGDMNTSPEEAWVLRQFERLGGKVCPEMRGIYSEAYAREFRRMFGDAYFDNLVQFDGYIPFWTSVFAFAPREMRKIIYLHNDMEGELKTRFPFLLRIFSLYENYDRLVSVSSSVHEANIGHLSKRYGLPVERFVQCDNLLNLTAVRELSSEPLDSHINEWVGTSTLLGTLGRLSPEKGHRKLILAFREVIDQVDLDLKLAIAGDGPLRRELEALIEDLGLTHRIKLVGQLPNPFPLLRRLDLFVFSSEYEGQGLAILEALLLEKPVVSTDVVGPRTVLQDGYGVLVENSKDGLASGIVQYFSNESQFRRFDAESYQRNALESFYQVISDPKEGPVILAARNDGLGERLNAIVNGLFIAERTGLRFAYHWPSTGSWEKLGSSGSSHAIAPNEQFFSQEFIRSYSTTRFNRSHFREINGKGVTREDLLAGSDAGGWIAPRVDVKSVLDQGLWPHATSNLSGSFRKIEFAPRIMKAIDEARESELPVGCVALHLRSGDIFYGPYRKLVNYTYKGITLPIAKALIDKLHLEGSAVLCFGQDQDVMRYLKSEKGILLLEDVALRDEMSADAAAMFEIILMSRCSRIVAGSSGFAKLASWIGNVPLLQPQRFFGANEQAEISFSDLEENASKYHPLQSAFGYWYAYFYGRHEKTFEFNDKLLERASSYDSGNELYPLKRASNCFHHGHYEEGDLHLKELLVGGGRDEGVSHETAFHVLTARTGVEFNMAEDFNAFAAAGLKGYPWAALCYFVIASSTADSEGLARVGEVLRGLGEISPEFSDLRGVVMDAN